MQQQHQHLDDGCGQAPLQLEVMLGFDGKVPGGLHVHPDGCHLIYPVGCTVVIENMSNKKQEFLSEHTNTVTCVAVSKTGNFLASGQKTHMGFKADVIIWDFHQRAEIVKLTLHMVKVEALAFSPNDLYLVSLGGPDDGSVVVWNIDTRKPICGAPAQVKSSGMTNTVAYSNHCDNTFITGGDNTLRVWELDVENRKIRPTEVSLGTVKRNVQCIEFEKDDSFFYCGTTSGDILSINMKYKNFKDAKTKEKFSLGVTALKLLANGEMLVGSGDGLVCLCKGKDNIFAKPTKTQKTQGAVTSIALRGVGHQFFIGTSMSQIYRFCSPSLEMELISTCHYDKVNDLIFPKGWPEVYCTCSVQDIRVWETQKNRELLRITVPNMVCNAVTFAPDGKSIISAWGDGRIRAFYPLSGKLMYTIEDAHPGGVSALATYNDTMHVVSGGKEGKVRVWEVRKTILQNGKSKWSTKLDFSLHEHKAEVTSIKVRSDNMECVTSCIDGSCIIWSLEKRCRIQMIRVNTLFKNVCYHPQEHQIITTGTDRKIACWETVDGCSIRELEGALDSINTLDISTDGKFFISAGDDKLIKLWKYDEGFMTHIGRGHSAPVTCAKLSPCGGLIMSVSADGAILKWRFPQV